MLDSVEEKVVRPGGLELPTFWFVARRSIQLSYGRADTLFTFNSLAQFLARFQPRVSPHSHPINSKWLGKNYLHVRASSAASTATTGGHVQTALPDARRTSCLSSLLAENAHPVKR